MTTAVLHYLGFGSRPQPQNDTKQTSVRSLPASWYTSDDMFELERRAIFSRRWLMMTHASRLRKAGDWLRYNVAGYDLIIIRDRAGDINALHNVCRHRAYPVIEKEGQGTAMILACRYHGWSYGLNGKLAKATGFQEIGGFDKNKNGLFRIHTKVDKNGLIWINMDAKDEPEVPWEEHFDKVDIQERYKPLNFDDYELDHTYELEGDYNWKILADNFNECYHCPTTHADVPSFLNLDTFWSDTEKGHIQHQCEYTEQQLAKGVNTASTYYFPNSSMSISPHFMMIQKFLPVGPKRSKMHYEVYRNTKSSDEDFQLISQTYAKVMAEDKILCTNAQRNMNAGVYTSGELHPRHEKAPLFFQKTVREVIREHYRKEKEAGMAIWPAKQRVISGSDEVAREDDEICQGLACVGVGGGGGGVQKVESLVW